MRSWKRTDQKLHWLKGQVVVGVGGTLFQRQALPLSLLRSASNPVARKLSQEFCFINVHDFWHHCLTSRSKRITFPLCCSGDLLQWGDREHALESRPPVGSLRKSWPSAQGGSATGRANWTLPCGFSFGKVARGMVSLLVFFGRSAWLRRERAGPRASTASEV